MFYSVTLLLANNNKQSNCIDAEYNYMHNTQLFIIYIHIHYKPT